MHDETPLHPRPGDALLVIDVQRDFLPGGALAVPAGDEVVEPLNRYARLFSVESLPTYASRDWHPANHCSFAEQGGPWPAHCVAGTDGAQFADGLRLSEDLHIVSKATEPGRDAYSVFAVDEFKERLRQQGIRRLFVGGLATEYCVLATVRDALAEGYAVVLLADAIRAIDRCGDGRRAVEQMTRLGAVVATWEDITSG